MLEVASLPVRLTVSVTAYDLSHGAPGSATENPVSLAIARALASVGAAGLGVAVSESRVLVGLAGEYIATLPPAAAHLKGAFDAGKPGDTLSFTLEIDGGKR